MSGRRTVFAAGDVASAPRPMTGTVPKWNRALLFFDGAAVQMGAWDSAHILWAPPSCLGRSGVMLPVALRKRKKQANTPADALRCKQEERREVGGEKREERGQKRNQNLGPRGLGSCVITPTVIREDLSSSNRQRRG